MGMRSGRLAFLRVAATEQTRPSFSKCIQERRRRRCQDLHVEFYGEDPPQQLDNLETMMRNADKLLLSGFILHTTAAGGDISRGPSQSDRLSRI